MMTEIGAFLHKGAGSAMLADLKKDKRVLGIYVEAGRTDDLFAFREFGSASENEIVTILVAENDADKGRRRQTARRRKAVKKGGQGCA